MDVVCCGREHMEGIGVGKGAAVVGHVPQPSRYDPPAELGV